MATRRINLSDYKSGSSTIFTGRPQGKSVRDKIELDKLDKTADTIIFVLPEDTTSFNPSFYLGLLFKSYDKLGVEGFEKKYSFEISSSEKETISVLQNNLDDGKRNAINSLNSKSSIKSIFGIK